MAWPVARSGSHRRRRGAAREHCCVWHVLPSGMWRAGPERSCRQTHLDPGRIPDGAHRRTCTVARVCYGAVRGLRATPLRLKSAVPRTLHIEAK